MSRLIIFAVLITVAVVGTAQADTRTLSWDDGNAVSMETQESLGHCILFFRQSDWNRTFSKQLQVYGQRYGDVGNHLVSVVILGEQNENTVKLEEYPDSLVIHSTKQVRMSQFPTEPGWVDIPLDVIDLPDSFWVSIYTRSREDFGVRIGKTSTTDSPSYCCSSKPGNPEKQKTATLSPWKDGANWMMRLEVSSTPTERIQLQSEDLTGKSFTLFDDGEVDGYYSFQRGGPCLHIKNNYSKKVDRIYFYASVDGDWYNTDRKAGVYILDERRRIVARTQLPFNSYTSDPAWNYVSLDSVAVPSEFYVQIEPFNRPGIELMLGYDASSDNQQSEFGTVGVLYDWTLDIPRESTNWMIRVEYN